MRIAMIKLALAAVLVAALPAPILAQATTPADLKGAPVPTTDFVPVAIDTTAGRIVVALDRTHAPVTTANFLRYIDTHRFDGEAFYRAMPIGNGGLIQGGIRSDARKLYPPIADEPTSKTGIKNDAGAIAMANGGPGTATADFFIMTAPVPSFDNSFAAFGHVVEGMDVVKAILASPVSATAGQGPMKGQMLEPMVKIIKISRVK